MHIQVWQHSQPESARCGYSVFVPLQELDTSETLLKIEKFNHSFPMFNLHFPTISFSEEFSAFLEALDYIGSVVGLVIEKTRCEHRGSRSVSYVGARGLVIGTGEFDVKQETYKHIK
jgi:hypothetical protein